MTQLYYIQHTKTYAYDFILWWGKDQKGYYYDLDQAGTYTKEEADKIVALRGEEVAWPVELVRASVSSAVSICDLRRTHEKDEFKVYERLAPPPKPYMPPSADYGIDGGDYDEEDDRKEARARASLEFRRLVDMCDEPADGAFAAGKSPLAKYTLESDNDDEYQAGPKVDLSPDRVKQLLDLDDEATSPVVEKIPHHLDTKRVGELLDEGRVLREAFEKRIAPMKRPIE